MANMAASQRQIARTFNCSQATISNLLSRYQQTGQAQDRPRSGRPRVKTSGRPRVTTSGRPRVTTSGRPRVTTSGRPRVTTPAEDCYIRTIHLRNRFMTATSTAATALGHPISRRSVLRRLRRAGIGAFRPFRGMA